MRYTSCSERDFYNSFIKCIIILYLFNIYRLFVEWKFFIFYPLLYRSNVLAHVGQVQSQIIGSFDRLYQYTNIDIYLLNYIYTFPHYFVQHAIHVCTLRIYTTNRTRLCVSISYTVRVNHPTKPAADHWRRRWVSSGYWRLKYIIHHIYI